MVSFHELHSLAISSVDRIFSISLSLSSFPLIVSYQWLCICLYLHQRWFKDNATGTIWPAHMPISMGAVIKSLLLPGAHWETHGTNKHTALLSPLCHWETVGCSEFARWQKTQFCWHSLETLNKPVYKEATVTQNFRWLKKLINTVRLMTFFMKDICL